jgi:hypothetical protein
MRIIISRTYAMISPESAELGDFCETGFICDREEVDFRELVDLMREHPHGSSSPWRKDDRHAWFSSGFYVYDYRNMLERETSIHFHEENSESAYKYWVWARIIANANS